MHISTSTPPSEWSRGRSIVLVSVIGMAIATSHTYAMGLFLGPIEEEFGWSRAQISSGLILNSIVGVLCAPLVGGLVDRVGTRRIGLPGMALYCCTVALLSTTSSSIWNWWGLWFVLALGAVCIKPMVWAVAVSRIFQKRRALALGGMMCGAGIGSTVLPFLITNLIGGYGWRGAYIALGAGMALLSLPLMFLFLRDDFSGSATRREQQEARNVLAGMSVREAALSWHFLRILLGTVIMTVVLAGLIVHFVPFAVSKGLSPAQAATAASFVGVATIFGRLTSGALLDRWNGPLIAAVTFSLPVFAMVLWLNFDGSMQSAVMITVIIGLTAGADMDIVAYLCSRYFGLKNYGTIFGVMAGLFALGSGVGPTLAGAVYDATRSYDLYAWAVIPSVLISAALIGSLGKYPSFAVEGDGQT